MEKYIEADREVIVLLTVFKKIRNDIFLLPWLVTAIPKKKLKINFPILSGPDSGDSYWVRTG